MGKKIISTYATEQVTNATKLLATTNGTTHLIDADSLVDVSEKIVDDVSSWEQGNMSITNNLSPDTNRIRTKYTLTKVDMNIQDVVNVKYLNPNFKYRIIFSSTETGNVIEGGVVTTWSTTPNVYVVPQGANYCHICLARTDSADFTPADGYDKIELYNGTRIIEDIIGNKISVLQKNVGNLYGKKISILGDSISTFTGYSYEGNRCRYPQSDLLTDVNDTYWMQIIKDLGLTLGINEAWAGTRISWDGTTESGDIGADKFIGSQTRINHLGENGTPDVILVFGGTNDIYNNVEKGTFDYSSPASYTSEQIAFLTSTTYADAIRTLLIRLQYTYPNSKIVFILPYFFTTLKKLDEYNEIMKEACDAYGVPVIDARTCGLTVFNTNDYLPDSLHLNSFGMGKLSNVVRHALMNLY